MARSDAARQVAMLKAAFPREPVSQETVGVYVTKLVDIEETLLSAAINRLIEESKFFPTIAEVRKMAARLAGLLPPVSAEALAVVRRADRRETIYRRDGSAAYEERYWDWPDDVPERTLELCCDVLKRVGDPVHKDTGEDHFAWETGFRDVYDAEVERSSGRLLANLSAARLPAHEQALLPESSEPKP